MADPFVGEIKIWSFGWAPRGWALCNGALLAVSQNQALFALIGTQFGGNGVTNFQLPDLRGRVAAGATFGSSSPGLTPYAQGAVGGAENVSLVAANFPTHNHMVQGVNVKATALNPAGMMPANATSTATTSTQAYQIYAGSWAAGATLNASTIGLDGGGAAHNNMQPYGVVNFSISLSGIFPSRN